MHYLNWLLRVLLFIALLGLAVKNDQPVAFRYFFGYEWQTSLVALLLLFFAVGVIAGALAVFGTVLQQRREIARLKRDMKTRDRFADAAEGQQQDNVQPS